MYNNPSSVELLQAVQTFIQKISKEELSGHSKFHARVASNVLDTVIREIEQRPLAEDKERERLMTLLKTSPDSDTETLNKRLSDAIREGKLSITDQSLLDHLKSTTIAQLLIDQPGYSGLDSD